MKPGAKKGTASARRVEKTTAKAVAHKTQPHKSRKASDRSLRAKTPRPGEDAHEPSKGLQPAIRKARAIASTGVTARPRGHTRQSK